MVFGSFLPAKSEAFILGFAGNIIDECFVAKVLESNVSALASKEALPYRRAQGTASNLSKLEMVMRDAPQIAPRAHS